jgi:hypothetical protein
MANAGLAQKSEDKRQSAVEAKSHEFIKRLGIKPSEFRRYTGMCNSTQEKYVQIRFDERQVKKWDFIEVIHITDAQAGHVAFRRDKMEEYNKWVLSEPNRFMVWGGDMIDAANIFSPGQPWENLFEAQSQVYQFCDMMAPVAHRVLGSCGGNHERRGLKGFGDIGILLNRLLGIPYSSGQQVVDVHFGDWKPFKIDLWHGKGAAITPGARMNMLYAAMMASDANLVLVGHLHDAFCKFRWLKVRDSSNMKLKFIKQGGAMSSSFLEYMGTYAEVANMPMSDCMMACARVESNGHWGLQMR